MSDPGATATIYGELNGPDAVAVLHTGGDAVIIAAADGTITFWNAGAERIFGRPPSDALGRSLDVIIPARLQARHWQAWDAVMGGAPSKYGPSDTLKVPAVRADGTSISVEFTITALREADGSIRAIAAILRDTTATFEQIRALRAGPGS